MPLPFPPFYSMEEHSPALILPVVVGHSALKDWDLRWADNAPPGDALLLYMDVPDSPPQLCPTAVGNPHLWAAEEETVRNAAASRAVPLAADLDLGNVWFSATEGLVAPLVLPPVMPRFSHIQFVCICMHFYLCVRVRASLSSKYHFARGQI